MRRLILLDNEAVQALMAVDHRKHRSALAVVQVVAARRRKAASIELEVPTAVRVEAGWDRTARNAAFVNLLRIRDAVLDTGAADLAAALLTEHGVSVPDAHLGAIVRARAGTAAITVVTSDPVDIRAVAGNVELTVLTL
jgi:predicted nucleic acid-binding protein